jgi:regulator of cell morphogenesis and NO signaling
MPNAAQSNPVAATAWDKQPLPAIIQHILETYHEPLRRELPELIRLAEIVEKKHEGLELCPTGLTGHLNAIHQAVLSHLEKEERILFPLIMAGRGPQATGPVQVMEVEHEDHLANLRHTRALTFDFTTPADACSAWVELYRRLGTLESELNEHIHLENQVLFPRALYE